MRRYSKRAIYDMADININEFAGIQFPAPESVEQVGYSRGVNGGTAKLYRGEESGRYYAGGVFAGIVGPYSWHRGVPSDSALGNRERLIVHSLDHAEQLESNEKYIVIRFVSTTGDFFVVASDDDGHTWHTIN